jgi:hypothetical protein
MLVDKPVLFSRLLSIVISGGTGGVALQLAHTRQADLCWLLLSIMNSDQYNELSSALYVDRAFYLLLPGTRVGDGKGPS